MKSRRMLTGLSVLIAVVLILQTRTVSSAQPVLQATSTATMMATSIALTQQSTIEATSAATLAATAPVANPFDPTRLREIADVLTKATSDKGDPTTIKLAVVVNVLSPFWTAAAIGEQRASSELGAPVVFEAPAQVGDIASQQSLLESLIADQYSGVSFSAIDPAAVVSLVRKGITQKVNFITMDSDSPDSGRTIYIGMNNYNGGVLAGKAMLNALGAHCGKVVGLVGFVTAQNAIDRIQGIKDTFKGTGCTLETVLVDNGDSTKALTNAESALATYPDLAGLIGVYSYNGPAAGQALKLAHKAGQIKLVSFDLDSQTLRQLKDKTVSAAIGQRVYYYGYLSVYVLYSMSVLGSDATLKLLDPYLIGDKHDSLDTGADIVTPDTLATYQEYLNSIGIRSQ